MPYPNRIRLTPEWIRSLSEAAVLVGGSYVPARSLGFCSLRSRIRCAWLVLTGRADALVWPEDFDDVE